MVTNESVELKRDCPAIEIPSGTPRILAKGSMARISQSSSSGYTVTTDGYGMYRIDAKDADALGIETTAVTEKKPDVPFSEQLVWDILKTVYDPEIPVNIVDLGLIYSCVITPREEGGKKVEIKMSMTAPGCGMGDVLKADIEQRISQLPEVNETHVEVVFDPPWNPGLMSEAAKLQLGFDLDYGNNNSSGRFPIFR